MRPFYLRSTGFLNAAAATAGKRPSPAKRSPRFALDYSWPYAASAWTFSNIALGCQAVLAVSDEAWGWAGGLGIACAASSVGCVFWVVRRLTRQAQPATAPDLDPAMAELIRRRDAMRRQRRLTLEQLISSDRALSSPAPIREYGAGRPRAVRPHQESVHGAR